MGKYTDYYRKRHGDGPGSYGRTGAKQVKYVLQALSGHGVKTVLDWGCGSNTLAKTLMGVRHDWKVDSYDPCVPGLDVLPEGKQWDAVVTTDVLEHIPLEEIDAALEQIIGLTRRVGYHHIANYLARESMPNGTNLHVLLEDAAWWKAKFEEHGVTVIEAIDLDPPGRSKYACITFLKEQK